MVAGFALSGVVLVEGIIAAEWVCANEVLGLFIHARDVGLQFGFLHPPLASTPNLDRPKVAAANEGVGLCGRNIENLRDIGEGQKARHGLILPSDGGLREVSSTGVAARGLQQDLLRSGCAREGASASSPGNEPD